VFLGPLIFSSNPRFNETQMDDKYCDDQKHLKELAKTIPDNEFKQAYADTVNIEKDILSMMSSNDEKKSIGNENKNASAYVPNKKSVLWDPKFQPRHKLHDELWWLLKEYRYEALVMILKVKITDL
jgi:DNA repair photolyase